MIIGLTGKYCSGKNLVAKILETYSIEIIDEDRIGHLALDEKREEIASEFGAPVVRADGSIDRRELGNRVFAESDALARLESIVHPWMVEETKRRAELSPAPHVAINAALLVKMGLHELCDFVVLVSAPAPVRFFRALRRDGFSPGAIFRRMWSQRFLNEGIKSVDTIVVRNIGSRRRLESRVRITLARRGLTGRKDDE